VLGDSTAIVRAIGIDRGLKNRFQHQLPFQDEFLKPFLTRLEQVSCRGRAVQFAPFLVLTDHSMCGTGSNLQKYVFFVNAAGFPLVTSQVSIDCAKFVSTSQLNLPGKIHFHKHQT
jgi:hypothetical protein